MLKQSDIMKENGLGKTTVMNKKLSTRKPQNPCNICISVGGGGVDYKTPIKRLNCLNFCAEIFQNTFVTWKNIFMSDFAVKLLPRLHKAGSRLYTFLPRPFGERVGVRGQHPNQTRHCEERSDEAIHTSIQSNKTRLPRYARNDANE